MIFAINFSFWALGTFGVFGLMPLAWCAWSRRLGRRYV
jgi:hypothetical protein